MHALSYKQFFDISVIKPKVKKLIPELNYLSDEDLDLIGSVARRLKRN